MTMVTNLVRTVGLLWLLAEAVVIVKCQAFERNVSARSGSSSEVSEAGSTLRTAESIHDISRVAFPYDDRQARNFDRNWGGQNQFGGQNQYGSYYHNSTHQIRGNVTEWVDPTYIRSSESGYQRTRYRNRDRERERFRDREYDREEPQYGRNQNVFNPGVEHTPAERDSSFRSYEDRVRDLPTGGSSSYGSDRDSSRGRDAGGTYDQQYPKPGQSGDRDFIGPRTNPGYDGTRGYPGTSDQGRTFAPGFTPSTSSDGRNHGSGAGGGGRSYPGDSYSGHGQGQGQTNYGVAVNPPGYPGNQFTQGPVFDPGYPNRNVWNEQWSTTTDRPTAPGVLGRWRTDLQGKQRPEDIHQLPKPVYVTTNYGRVQGFKVKLYDGPDVPPPSRPGITQVEKVQQTISSFVGIPYARPPVREGRFRPPRQHTGWQQLQAVEFGPACPQPARFFGSTYNPGGVVQMDEDCLYLNVFSPDVGSGAKGSPYPVLFYIHDGDFSHGSSNEFPPHQLVGWYDLVVVTVNYRLGALGFLSTADEFSPGNYGMLDLSLALRWVHENIRAFNGDPDRITLVGLGSGAAAAGLMMLSPRTRGYIKNVVAMEGAPTADWAAIVDKYRLQNTTVLFSQKLGCWHQYEQTSYKMVECLRSRSWQELGNLELEPDVGTFPWSPAVDREFRIPAVDYFADWKEEDWKFLPDDPLALLRHGEYPMIRYMTGWSRQSAADLLYANKTLAPNYIVTRDWFDMMIHRWVKKYNYTLNPEGVFSAIKHGYTYHPDPMNVTHLREEYIDFLSDALYRGPIDQTVKLLLARGIQVHQYLLNYTLEGLRLPFWREVPRGMEYYLLSGAPFMDPEFYPDRLRVDRSAWTEGDRNMSNFFMSAVANLAHFGQPTRHEILGIFWEHTKAGDLKYLSLNATNNSTMQRNYRQREVTFWTEYMPYVVGRYVPTYPPTTEYWWEPNEPLQIAFWSVSGICMILIVALVACCLLWRTAKKQRDRIYDDLGLSNAPPIGTIVGDELSDYAETIKTMDSIDSGVKMPIHHHHMHPMPGSQHSTNTSLPYIDTHRPSSAAGGPSSIGGQSSMGRQSTGQLRGERYPTPRKNRRLDDVPQTQV